MMDTTPSTGAAQGLATEDAAQHALPGTSGHDEWKATARRLLRNRKFLIGFLSLFVIIISVVGAPILQLDDPNKQVLLNKLLPPVWNGGTWSHPLGTDHLGRDMLSRIIWGGRISLLVGFSALVISGTIGVLIGLISGALRGRIDTILMRLADTQLAFPQLLLVILVLVMLGRSVLAIIVVLAVADWVIYARMVRGRVLGEREREYVDAARSIGATQLRVIFRHILPNLIPLIVVIGALQFGVMIMLESSLSFLGIGVQPPTSSWGRMLNDGQGYIAIAWWVATLPGLAIVFTVLGANLLADGLREVFGIE